MKNKSEYYNRSACKIEGKKEKQREKKSKKKRKTKRKASVA